MLRSLRLIAVLQIVVSAGCQWMDVPAGQVHEEALMGQTPIRVELKIDLAVSAVNAHLTFTNTSDKSFALYKINACSDGRIRNNLFRIVSGNTRIRYTGKLAKRPKPGKSDFVVVQPGGRLEATVRLDETYAFPTGHAAYVATYEAFNPSIGEQGLTKLVSNECPFTLAR